MIAYHIEMQAFDCSYFGGCAEMSHEGPDAVDHH